MYSYAIKGGTLGSIVGRRLLRTLFAIPGFALDLIVGTFWAEGFNHYWHTKSFEFSDKTQFTFYAGYTGWIGDQLGQGLGIAIGVTIGLALFLPDTAITLATKVIRSGMQYLDDFAAYLGKTPFFNQSFTLFDPQSNEHTELQNYLSAAWNIGTVAAGVVGFVPYAICRAVEYFLPIGNVVSNTLLKGVGLVGGTISAALAVFPGLLATHFLKKCCDLHDAVHTAIKKHTAVIYAKTNTIVSEDTPNHCIQPSLIYDDEFKREYQHAHHHSMATILFTLNENPVKNIKIPNGELTDPITQKSLVESKRNVVSIPCGHSFLDYGKENKGLSGWLASKSNHENCPCPVCRKGFKKEDIVQNVAFNEIKQATKNSR